MSQQLKTREMAELDLVSRTTTKQKKKQEERVPVFVTRNTDISW